MIVKEAVNRMHALDLSRVPSAAEIREKWAQLCAAIQYDNMSVEWAYETLREWLISKLEGE
jgi:tRNA A37 N6-isopentenylltransferase MiaA